MKSIFPRLAAIFTPIFAAMFFASPALAVPFSLTTPTPSNTFVFADTVISANFSMPPGAFLDYCELFVDGFDSGEMTRTAGDYSAGTVSINFAYDTVGSHPTMVECHNDLGDIVGKSVSMTVDADFDNPHVTLLSPAIAVAGASVTISANYSDTDFGSGIDYCSLSVDGVTTGIDMALSGGASSRFGTASQSYTFSNAGSHPVGISCTDMSGNTGFLTGNINVSAPTDTSAPVVAQIASITPTQNVATTISATYWDYVGVTSCKLFVNDVDWGTMSLSGTLSGTASKSFAFNPSGTHSVYVRCYDAAGNSAAGATRTITVSAPSSDVTPPIIGSLSASPSSRSVGTALTLSVSPADNIGVTRCEIYVNGFNNGDMTTSGSNFTKSYTITGTTADLFSARCYDAAGNSSTSPDLYIEATGTGSTPDTAAPIVTSINPSAATAGSPVNVSASFSDTVGVASCSLYVNDSFDGTMDRTGSVSGTATRSRTFSTAGSYNLRVNCSDAAGNTSYATATLVVTNTGYVGPYVNRLVKLSCPAGYVDVNHPCKAVYYVGSDGKRHAFPNERVYFTWYSNFDGVLDLDAGSLSGVPLGSNVNYRPGMRMVKFTTVNKVYAVGRYGSLRWVTSESVATTLYGSNWNTKIDDVSDAFYTDYTFGSDIVSASSFNPTVEAVTVGSIDVNLR